MSSASSPPPPPDVPSYGGSAAPYGSPLGELVTWGPRVGAFLIDRLISIGPALVIAIIGAILLTTGAHTNGSGQVTGYGPVGIVGFFVEGLAYLSVLVIEIWNRCIKAGRTGQSIGKRMLGMYLLGERTGQPIGGGMAFVRELCHFVDGFICDVGYLFPLWDAKRQTLADKIVSTVVVRSPPAAVGRSDYGRLPPPVQDDPSATWR